MNQFIVNTGFGYFTEDGRIVSKARLGKGSHPIRDGANYVEVADQAALDAVQVFIDPAVQKEADDIKAIQAAIEKLAISEAKKDGYVFKSDKYKDK